MGKITYQPVDLGMFRTHPIDPQFPHQNNGFFRVFSASQMAGLHASLDFFNRFDCRMAPTLEGVEMWTLDRCLGTCYPPKMEP